MTFFAPIPFQAKINGYRDDISVATANKTLAMATKNLALICDYILKWMASRKLHLNA